MEYIDEKIELELRNISLEIAMKVTEVLINLVDEAKTENRYRGKILIDAMIMMLAKNTMTSSRAFHGKTIKEGLDIVTEYIETVFTRIMKEYSKQNDMNEIMKCDNPNCDTHSNENKTVQ